MPVTTANSIWFPDNTAPISPIENLFSQMATSVDTMGTSIKQITDTMVANQAARDALFPSPTQGNAVWRVDLGWTERYYAVYNSSSNPGGALSAGWYPDDGVGVAAVPNSSASIGTTFVRIGWSQSMSKGFTFNAANGEFVPTYTGVYQISMSIGTGAATAQSYIQASSGSGNYYAYGTTAAITSGTSTAFLTAGTPYSPYVATGTGSGSIRADRSTYGVSWIGVRQQ